MARNVEIKARLHDPAATTAAAERLAGSPPEIIDQHDTFYGSARGRLKLRRFPDGRGELIAYDRPDQPGPKTSHYHLYGTTDAAGLEAVLNAGLEPLADVRKRRRLYRVGRTRVHLDQVEDLGAFLELEVVMADGEDLARGEAEAADLLASLGVATDDLVAAAYVDLLVARRDSGTA
jgi:adenylate cyclase